MSDWLEYGRDRRRPASKSRDLALPGAGDTIPQGCRGGAELQVLLRLEDAAGRRDDVRVDVRALTGGMVGRLQELVARNPAFEYVERSDGEVAHGFDRFEHSSSMSDDSESVLDRVEKGLRSILTVRSGSRDARSEHERFLAMAAAVHSLYGTGSTTAPVMPRRRVA